MKLLINDRSIFGFDVADLGDDFTSSLPEPGFDPPEVVVDAFGPDEVFMVSTLT